MSLLSDLRARAGIHSLLSRPDANPKVAKNQKIGALTTVLHLAPGNMSGREVCPKRSPGCSAACLHFAGNPAQYDHKTKARLKKTELFFRDRKLFLQILALELEAHQRAAARKGMKAAARLNGTSDIVWEKYGIIDQFPDISFYDYTKIPRRTPPANYHLTFSESEINALEVQVEMARGFNIATVFIDKLPEFHRGRPVISGDEHDYRPADGRGVVVGLVAKGKLAKADESGFVSRNTASEVLAA